VAEIVGIWNFGAVQQRMAVCQANVREAAAACDAVDARLQAVECEDHGAGEQVELQPSKLVRPEGRRRALGVWLLRDSSG